MEKTEESAVLVKLKELNIFLLELKEKSMKCYIDEYINHTNGKHKWFKKKEEKKLAEAKGG